jgi:hypothetical protein
MDFVIGSLKYTTLTETTVSVQKNESISGALTIPATVTYNDVTYDVTQINYSGFADQSSMTSVVIPDSVTVIDSYAFRACNSLTEIYLGSGITNINMFAFQTTSYVPPIRNVYITDLASYC